MEKKTIEALKWITDIFGCYSIPYMIGGGFAAHYYGSQRPINDLDISLSGRYFPEIVDNVKEYITAGPKHYSNEKWDCDTLSLTYKGQDVDITDVETVKMSSKDGSEWFKSKDHFRKYPAKNVVIEGIKVSLMDPRDLVAYKKHLGGEHQLADVHTVEKYIQENHINGCYDC